MYGPYLRAVNLTVGIACAPMPCRPMFCPLCKAEYRAGAEVCNDCNSRLVPSEAEARRVPIRLLWQGVNNRKFGDIAGALKDASIPCFARSGADPNKPLRFGWLGYVGILLQFAESVDRFMWLIDVLESDYATAEKIRDSVLS